MRVSKLHTLGIDFDCRDLLSEFHSVLTEENISKPLLILIDGVDLITDGKACDWIPLQIPKVSKRQVSVASCLQSVRKKNMSFLSQGVCLVISLTSKTALLQTLAKKRGALLFTLGPLTVPERREIVEKGLDTFGKKLSDTAFNNQVLFYVFVSTQFFFVRLVVVPSKMDVHKVCLRPEVISVGPLNFFLCFLSSRHW